MKELIVGTSPLLSRIMQLESLAKDARRRARKEYSGTSSAQQQRDLGKIASPLRLQMPENLSRIELHFLDEGTTGKDAC
ncbi:hypothetical protein DBT_0622 [Dissulfuribacter thermophilus]|uniref:Uncharacterized protein n=1 Tax=Dissulfuribacter thermophilus TaxID=1156395 RepID=A0A1B9F8D1_9BACT|nr:hypothetical protein [Dissulfuribacter thermophilus]OCC16160.1 hypothetical protein DBT_0622 [Dissulfuribacter thermophilus]